jgi:hypothetical protein
VFGPPPGPVDAVVGFTAHHCIAAAVDGAAVLRRLPPGELSALLSAGFLTWLASELGSAAGSLDMFEPSDSRRCFLLPEAHPQAAGSKPWVATK